MLSMRKKYVNLILPSALHDNHCMAVHEIQYSTGVTSASPFTLCRGVCSLAVQQQQLAWWQPTAMT